MIERSRIEDILSEMQVRCPSEVQAFRLEMDCYDGGRYQTFFDISDIAMIARRSGLFDLNQKLIKIVEAEFR